MTQQRPLLGLVLLHAPQDVVQRAHRVQDVRALVEHHALGAPAHRRVGDLGARGHAGLGQRLQHLGGPDHRHVRGLAGPQDLLLHLGHALVAALHGEVAARDHHAGGRAGPSPPAASGQVLEAAPRLDLQDHAQVPAPSRAAAGAAATSSRRLGEGQATMSACATTSVQVFRSFAGQRRQLERCPAG
jgi:hypothetical protein